MKKKKKEDKEDKIYELFSVLSNACKIKFLKLSKENDPIKAYILKTEINGIISEMKNITDTVGSIKVNVNIENILDPKIKTKSSLKNPPEKKHKYPLKSNTKAEYKKNILGIIRKKRKEKATYKEIAEILNEQELPPFSLNGKWHSQTIHRLCTQ